MKETQAFTPEEVSQILKITKYTVYEMVKRGELPAYRVGNKIRIDPRDLEAYMNQGKKSEAGNLSTTQFEQPLPLKMPGLETAPQKTGGILICGQDILLDILARYVENHPQGCRVLRQNVGSFAGLLALYQGRADMAAVHLWDGDTGSYNTPYVRHFLPGIPTVIIHLACRMQGFYVAKGNPKNIQGWDDLKRDDLVYINREPGCGTRVLLDETLFKIGINRKTIPGYEREETSHLAVASTVARGQADVGLGNEKAALQVKGIDFIPLHKERYELVLKQEDLGKAEFQAVLEVLTSQAFQNEILGLGDYDLSITGQIVSMPTGH